MKHVTIILLSGSIGSGKTTLGQDLVRRLNARHVRTSALLRKGLGKQPTSRDDLQLISRRPTFRAGEWIVEATLGLLREPQPAHIVVIDSVRTVEQIHAMRMAAGRAWRLLHVHLTGDEKELEARFRSRRRGEDLGVDWRAAAGNPSESELADLESDADLLVDTSRAKPEDVLTRVLARVRPGGPLRAPCVDALVGGQWGSEGKGNLAFFLAPEYDLLIRVGGPNAGHRVHGYDGTTYTHRQLPSGTRSTNARLLLGPGAIIRPDILLREIADCNVTAERLVIDQNALIIEDEDVLAEAALKPAIGSTGMGVGAASARRIISRSQPGRVRTARDVPELSAFVSESARVLEQAYANGWSILLEGTQGTGLSLLHGSWPHVTSRDTTVSALLSEVGIAPERLRRVIVVFRAYPIRVGGASGPMGNEISWNDIAQRAGLEAERIRATELGSVSHNQRRVAEFSWAQLAPTTRLNGATDVALTFADYIDARNRSACRLDQLTEETIRFIEEMELVAQAPVSLISTRFDGRGFIDRRLW